MSRLSCRHVCGLAGLAGSSAKLIQAARPSQPIHLQYGDPSEVRPGAAGPRRSTSSEETGNVQANLEDPLRGPPARGRIAGVRWTLQAQASAGGSGSTAAPDRPACLAPISNITVPALLGYQVSLDGSGTTTPPRHSLRPRATPTSRSRWPRDRSGRSLSRTTPANSSDVTITNETMTFQLFQDLTPNHCQPHHQHAHQRPHNYYTQGFPNQTPPVPPASTSRASPPLTARMARAARASPRSREGRAARPARRRRAG